MESFSSVNSSTELFQIHRPCDCRGIFQHHVIPGQTDGDMAPRHPDVPDQSIGRSDARRRVLQGGGGAVQFVDR